MIEYETTMVMRPELGGDQVEATLDRVREVLRTQGGKLLALNHWGKKRLAYDIAKQSRGIYVLAHYLGQGPAVAELERNLRISDSVMRFMTIRLADDVSADSRQEVAYVRPAYETFEQQATDDAGDFGGEGEFGGRGERDRGDRGDRPARRSGDVHQARGGDGDEAPGDRGAAAAPRGGAGEADRPAAAAAHGDRRS